MTQSLVDRLPDAVVECPTSFDLYPSQGCTIPTAQELVTAVTAFFRDAVAYGSVDVEYA